MFGGNGGVGGGGIGGGRDEYCLLPLGLLRGLLRGLVRGLVRVLGLLVKLFVKVVLNLDVGDMGVMGVMLRDMWRL